MLIFYNCRSLFNTDELHITLICKENKKRIHFVPFFVSCHIFDTIPLLCGTDG